MRDRTPGATRLRIARRVSILYFAAYAVFVTWPGVLPFRGPRPFVLGLPFPLVWVSLWVIGGFFIFLLLENAYRATSESDASDPPKQH